MIADVGDAAAQFFFRWRMLRELLRFVPRDFQNVAVADNVRHSQRRESGLLGPEKLTRSAELHVHLGDVEAVVRFHHRSYPLFARVVQLAGDQYTEALLGSPAYAAAQLVQLSQAETLRLFDDHDGCVGYVHADFDDGGGDEYGEFAALELIHDCLFGVGRQLSMQQANRQARVDDLRQMLVHLFGGLHSLRFRFFNDRVDDVSLTAEIDLLLEEAVDAFDLVFGYVLCDDGPSARRKLVDHSYIEVAIDRERQRARDGCSRHHEHVRMPAFLKKLQTLQDAKAMLFVHDGQAKALE